MRALRDEKSDRPTNVRSKITNNRHRIPGLDGRTATGRRCWDLVNAYVAALGGWSKVNDLVLMDIRRAAQLTTIAEEARTLALQTAAGKVDLAALTRVEGAADRAVRRLGIKPGAAGNRVVPLRERLREGTG
jgi:hypothetical protein